MNMKTWLLFLPLTCNLIAGDIPTDDFTHWRLGAPEKRRQSIQTAEYSPEIGKVLEIKMIPSAFSYVELRCRKPLPVAASPEDLKKLSFSLELLAKPAETVMAVSVRLIDATGEFFQFRATPFQLRAGNWSKITVPIGKPSNVWGGNNDGKMDFPVRFSMLTVDCRKETAVPVTLMIDNLEFHKQ